MEAFLPTPKLDQIKELLETGKLKSIHAKYEDTLFSLSTLQVIQKSKQIFRICILDQK